MTIIRQNTCSTCAFKEREGKIMRCHRRAPVTTPIIAGGPAGQPQLVGDVTLFPTVSADMWCGEWSNFTVSKMVPVSDLAKAG